MSKEFSKTFEIVNKLANVTDIEKSADGHQLKNMVLLCEFQGYSCNIER